MFQLFLCKNKALWEECVCVTNELVNRFSSSFFVWISDTWQISRISLLESYWIQNSIHIFYAQIRNLNMVLRENPLWNGYLTISHSCFHSFCRRKECLLSFNVPRSISQTCHIFHSIPYYVRKYWPRSKAFVAFYRQYASAAIKTKNEWRLCRIVRNTVICHLNSYLILRCLAPWSFQYFRSHEFFFPLKSDSSIFSEYSNWIAEHNFKLRQLKK